MQQGLEILKYHEADCVYFWSTWKQEVEIFQQIVFVRLVAKCYRFSDFCFK